MAVLRVVNDSGQVVDREVTSRRAAFVKKDESALVSSYDIGEYGNDEFIPAVVQRIEYDREGGMSQISTVCGETENRRESDKNPDITVEGIVTEDQLNELKTLDQADSLLFVSDLDSGEVIVHRITVEQNTDIIHYSPNGDTDKLAFTFQVQLKYPE